MSTAALASPLPDVLQAVLDVSLTAVVLLRPVHSPGGEEIVDFSLDYFNPAGQRMTGLAEQPGGTLLARFPHAAASGIFGYYRQAYETGEPAAYAVNYQADGLDNYYRFAARRQGEWLVVSFTDTADQDRSAVELALRQSQAQEYEARAQAEAQRQRLYELLMQLPANVAVYHGPEHVITLANEPYRRLFAPRVLPGQTASQALPELVEQGLAALLDQVYRTGQPVAGVELAMRWPAAAPGEPSQHYFETFLQPLRDAQGGITGVLDCSFDVTDQVLARHAAQATTEELEARVLARTAEVQQQQRQLSEILGQVPAAIATLNGPEHRYGFVNERYQQIVAGRARLGETVAQVLPEAVEQGFVALLDQVYATGEPYVEEGRPAVFQDAPAVAPRAHYLDISYQRLLDGQDRPQGILAFVVDATERVRDRQQTQALQTALLEAAQHRAQERQDLLSLFEHAPVAVALLREADHRLDYFNSRFAELYAGAQQGHPIAELYPHIVTPEVVGRLDRVYQTGDSHHGPEALLTGRPAGEAARYVSFTYQAYREADQVAGVAVFIHEITGQVLARQQLEEQARQFRELYEQAPAAVCILRGPEFVVELANPAILRIWGLTAEQALGRPRLELLPETSRASLRAVLETPYRTRRTHHVQEFPVVLGRSHSGQPDQGYFNFIYQPLLDEHGTPVALTCVGIEVTEQVRARQQVEQLNQELEGRVQERTQQLEAARGATERERTLLQALLTQAPVAIGLFQGDELRVAAANAQMAALWGATPEQVVGRPLLAGVPELQGQGFDDLLRQVLRTQVPVAGTETPAVLLRDGQPETTYYNFVYQPLYDPEGQVLGVIDVAVEVTEQVRARQQVEQLNQELEGRVQERTRELAAQQALLSQILGQTPAYIATFSGPELRLSFFNANFQRLLAGRAALGRTLAEVQPEAVAQGFSALLHQVQASGQPLVQTAAPVGIAQPGGELQPGYYDITLLPLGQAQGVLVFAVDVTEQVLARQERERQQQRLERLLLAAPAAICILDGPALTYELVNPAYQQLFPGRELLGRPLLAALPELAGQRVWQTLVEVYQTGRTHQERGMHIPVARYQGGPLEDFYFNYVQQPRYNAHGQIDGVVVFAFDISEQVRVRQQVQVLNEELTTANEELAASNRQLTRTNVDLDTFVYTASHDLKAPITNIEGIVLALRETIPVEVQQEATVAHLFGLLDHTVDRFLTTIDQLTDLSRLQRAHAEPAELVALAPAIEAVRLDLAPIMAAAQAQLVVDVPAGLQLSFSPSNLRSILYNLLSNAFKYRAPERPAQVRVQARAQPGAVVLTVQDNGLGLSEAQQQRLFGLFQRLHTHVEGTGVGLYMIKRLIENAGARIEVASRPGEGSTFTVTFPT